MKHNEKEAKKRFISMIEEINPDSILEKLAISKDKNFFMAVKC